MTETTETSSSPRRSIQDLTGATAPATAVPTPKSRWAVRVLVPAGIVLAVLVMLIYASWGRLVPAAPVRVVPVVVKSVQAMEVGSVKPLVLLCDC